MPLSSDKTRLMSYGYAEPLADRDREVSSTTDALQISTGTPRVLRTTETVVSSTTKRHARGENPYTVLTSNVSTQAERLHIIADRAKAPPRTTLCGDSVYGISTQLALGLRVSGAHRTAGSVSRPLPARASGVRPAISLRQRMVDGQSAGYLPYLTLPKVVRYVWPLDYINFKQHSQTFGLTGLRPPPRP